MQLEGVNVQRMLITFGLLALLAIVGSGCGSGHLPPPGAVTYADPAIADAAPYETPAPVAQHPYRMHIGDTLTLFILGHPDLSGPVKVRPDGMITVPGAGDIQAAGQTMPELTEAVRVELRRILRYPDVSLMLSDYTDLQVYVFGEVRIPGAHTYVPEMTALHALGAAAGVTNRGGLHSVLVLRRGGPTELEVYRIDLDDAIDGEAIARDLVLEPFDVVVVPKSIIGEVNVFVERFIRQNIAPFTAYIEGWRAFHIEEINGYRLD